MKEATPLVSRVGIGCYSLSGAYGKKDTGEFRKMLEGAVEEGVTFFDTAETYGDEAERILGQTLKRVRNRVWISTKAGVKGKDKPDLSRNAVNESCENSLRSLATDYIDLYLVHFDDPRTSVEETVGALKDLVKEGKIRYYGVSHLPIRRIEEYCRVGNIFSIMGEFSAVSPQARENIFPLCQENDLGMIAFSVTGRGILTGRFDEERTFEAGDIRKLDPLFQRDRMKFALAISAKLKELSQELGITRAQLAISWVLSHPEVWVALTGPSTVSHMLENSQAADKSLSRDVIDEINEAIRKELTTLRQRQKESLKDLLETELSSDSSQALSDMLYAVETAVEAGQITEDQVMEKMMAIFSMRDRNSGEFRERLESLKKMLLEQFDIEKPKS